MKKIILIDLILIIILIGSVCKSIAQTNKQTEAIATTTVGVTIITAENYIQIDQTSDSSFIINEDDNYNITLPKFLIICNESGAPIVVNSFIINLDKLKWSQNVTIKPIINTNRQAKGIYNRSFDVIIEHE